MKLILAMTEQAKVITKKSTPYEFDGKKGISYKVGLKVGNDLETLSVTESLYDQIKEDDSYFFVGEIDTSYKNQKFTLSMIVAPDKSATPHGSGSPDAKK